MAGKWKNKLFVLLLTAMVSHAASAQCASSVNSFQPGEKLSYQLLYTWGFIWINAADAHFSITSQKIGTAPAYLFSAKASSVKTFDWFFKVRDNFQSLVMAEKFTPVWFEQNTSEGGWDVRQTYSFDPSGRKIFHKGKIGRRTPVNDTVQVSACTFDVLSAIYYCRTLPFGQYKVNDKTTVNTLIDGKLYPIQFKFLGRETIPGLHRKEKYSCYKLEATAIESTNFKEGQKIFVWITDDDNHLPILAEAKVIVGSVKAYLDKYEGVRHPVKTRMVATK